MVWAMILAAGESKRMGKPKLLLPFGDKTIIETIVQTVVSSKVEKTLVILGSEREKIEEKIKNYPVKIVYNRDFRSGMLSSVQCGLEALPEEAKAVLVVLGDQPKISTTVINKLIDAYKSSGKGIVLPVYKKERGHPVLVDVKYREEVKNLSPEVGLRGTVYNHPEDILEVEVETPSIFQDIDDQSDYKKELKNNE
ncbi:MAG: NTP transferase domain-containing protein [Candidatus Aminicenantes bacterium]|nr:NTP transferase domain-containing protein [Candidatus Aminicenantes bacterium]